MSNSNGKGKLTNKERLKLMQKLGAEIVASKSGIIGNISTSRSEKALPDHLKCDSFLLYTADQEIGAAHQSFIVFILKRLVDKL